MVKFWVDARARAGWGAPTLGLALAKKDEQMCTALSTALTCALWGANQILTPYPHARLFAQLFRLRKHQLHVAVIVLFLFSPSCACGPRQLGIRIGIR